MGLFKSADEIYDQAVDMIGRKDFNGARDKFEKAVSKGCSKQDLANFYIAMIDLSKGFGNTKAYDHVRETVSKLPSGSITFGVGSADRDMIIKQCELAVKEIEANNMDDSNYMAKGQALINIAVEISAAFGDNSFPLQELINGRSNTGTREAQTLQAVAYEVMGKGCVYSNPKQGSEYLQMAYNFRKQLGDSGDEDLQLMKKFATTARCWLCKRDVSGEGVHFMAVRSTISPMFREKESNEAIRSEDENFQTLYMCMPCYSAISNRSDEISRKYYEDCMERIAAVEAHLEAEISALRFSQFHR